MVFRTNFLFFWVGFNLFFFFGIIYLINSTNPTELYSG
jgi:hypothetical protein